VALTTVVELNAEFRRQVRAYFSISVWFLGHSVCIEMFLCAYQSSVGQQVGVESKVCSGLVDVERF
jgi:uncharacterized membrane protein